MTARSPSSEATRWPPFDLADALATQRQQPRFGRLEAAGLVRSLYAIQADVIELDSERDQTFLVVPADGDRCILKIANHAERIDVLEFQAGLLETIARNDPELGSQRLILTIEGDQIGRAQSSGRSHAVRLLTFVAGTSAFDSRRRSRLHRRRVGELVARLARATRAYTHPAADHPLVWDVKRAHQLQPLVALIEDDTVRSVAASALMWFERTGLPGLATLPARIVHGDLSRSNILVDPSDPDTITGVVDFGDAVEAPVVVDLAVAASFQACDELDPGAAVYDVIDGYRAAAVLDAEEARLLSGLVCTRLAMRIAIDAWRARSFPRGSGAATSSLPQRVALRALWSAQQVGV